MSVKALIKKKRDGGTHTREELDLLMKSLISGQAKDYQLSAWLMAVYLKGMTNEETVALVEAMWQSGQTIPRSTRGTGVDFYIDKHSTGGVGDKTSLILVPLVSSVCERLLGKGFLKIPMLSGRALGHSGGTLDKLEAVPGFRTALSLNEATALLDRSGFFMMGQTDTIVPADRLLYALRDSTSTVESLPLVVSSILSKKLAENLDGIVFDVKFGEGAFFKEPQEARVLGQTLIDVAKRLGVRAKGLLTRMDEPLGRAVGHSLEIEECAEFLSGGPREKSLDEVTMRLALAMVEMATNGEVTGSQAEEELELEISTRRAWEQFVLMFEQQGGDWHRYQEQSERWKKDRGVYVYRASQSGYVTQVNARRVAAILDAVGGLRPHKEFALDMMTGIEVFKKAGDAVTNGDAILEVHYRKEKHADLAVIENLCKEACQFSSTPVAKLPWVAEEIS